MKEFYIIATKQVTGKVSYELEARIVVTAPNLSLAYREIRKIPEFKFVHLREE